MIFILGSTDTVNSYPQIPNKMAVGLLTIELDLPMNDSLKGKRSVLRPLIARIRRDYNVSVCEADLQDMVRSSVVEVACVSTDSTQAHRQLQKIAKHVEHWRFDAQLVDYSIEMLG